MVIDDTMPSVIGFLDKNIRISVDKTPIVDAEVGINASIRISQPAVRIHGKTDCLRLRYGRNAGSAYLLCPLWCIRMYCRKHRLPENHGYELALSMVPDNRRLITIEEGSREFDLIKRDESGHATNSVYIF